MNTIRPGYVDTSTAGICVGGACEIKVWLTPVFYMWVESVTTR